MRKWELEVEPWPLELRLTPPQFNLASPFQQQVTVNLSSGQQ